ncbi:hypothetical protein KBK19_08730 [Microvirga sp. STR05]|uniref:STAS/SEC14 domain-containing protein n=1 Tax=Hymenobacter duratus TaxID=2771356 RepID=A0ABR8JE37_9BACT|nr:hypothetical protein [Hymenobacter duratus]MBD2715118.1 hypothetical protein [Hymenobacter duratus]MBR7950024.1 hypothetical protein [Microvirga sp. STR05]
MTVVASHPSLTIHLHSGSAAALETEWLGFTGSRDFRRYITEALALARQHGVTGWIANDQLLGAVRPVDLDWVAKHVLPALMKLGIRRFARLDAQDTMNRLLIGRMYQQAATSPQFELRSFSDPKQAREWAVA